MNFLAKHNLSQINNNIDVLFLRILRLKIFTGLFYSSSTLKAAAKKYNHSICIFNCYVSNIINHEKEFC
jgi:hypothetical protein